jgi:hypothetical protein
MTSAWSHAIDHQTRSQSDSSTLKSAIISSVQHIAVGWWGCILRFALVLWVVRVPLSTTVFGLLLLGATPQAQDLFVEFARPSPWWRLWFLFVLVAVWAMPTHYAARLLLDTDQRFQSYLKHEQWESERSAKLISDPSRCLEWSEIWIPRILGFLTFVAVELAILRSYTNLPTLDKSEAIALATVLHALIEMALLVAAGAVAYLIWVIKRPRRVRLPGSLTWLSAKLGNLWQKIAPGRVAGAADEESRDIGRLILAGLFVIFLGIFAFGADLAGAIFPRAMAVPFILGGWLPFLSYLSGVGRQISAPLIVGVIVLIAVLIAVLGDNHSVRRITSDKVPPLVLQDAVDLWMTENKCNPKTSGATFAHCPRPIIIAAAGGASRAGFFMASIIGYFLQPWDASKYHLDIKDVRNRLFAISSVSGGSMGAVMVTAALNAATPTTDNPPCVHGAVDQWWGEVVNYCVIVSKP